MGTTRPPLDTERQLNPRQRRYRRITNEGVRLAALVGVLLVALAVSGAVVTHHDRAHTVGNTVWLDADGWAQRENMPMSHVKQVPNDNPTSGAGPPNSDEIGSFANFLGVGTNVHEVRVLDESSGHTVIYTGYFNDPAAMAQAVAPFNGVANIYITVNPVKPEVMSRAPNQLQRAKARSTVAADADLSNVPVAAADDDIAEVQYLYIDIDSQRPAGVCSTDAEHAAAQEVRDAMGTAVAQAVGACAFSLSSGNCAALVYRLKSGLPASDGSMRIPRVLKALASRFDTNEVKIDTVVGNPARIMRLPGTLNVKKEEAGRPRRVARQDGQVSDQVDLDLDRLEDWLGLGSVASANATPVASGNGNEVVTPDEHDQLLEAWNRATANHSRHRLALGIAGAARKAGHAERDVEALVRRLATEAGDTELANRVQAVRTTYSKKKDEVIGWTELTAQGLKPNQLPSLLDPAASTGHESVAARLVALSEGLELIRDQQKTSYAVVRQPAGHRELLRVRGRAFSRWLASQLYEMERVVPGRDAVAAAVGIIDERAQRGEQLPLENRVARGQDGAIWIDLGDEQRRAVRVVPGSWTIVNDPPPMFRRHPHQAALPIPDSNGSPWELLKFMNIPRREESTLFILTTMFAFVPGVPQPILVLHGPQGSAKSTAAKMRRSLIDPSATPTTTVRNEIGEFVQALDQHYAPLLDNVSRLQEWQSNLICQVATGGAFMKRELYTDDESVLTTLRRPITITAINLPATLADLPDRAVLVRMDRISPEHRRPEAELWAAFEKARPALFGGLLNMLASAMAWLPQVKLVKLTRMADFALWAAAAGKACSISEAEILAMLLDNAGRQSEEAVENDPVATAIRDFAPAVGAPPWVGTATELYTQLQSVPGVNSSARDWPKRPAELGKRLLIAQAPLAELGVRVLPDKETTGARRRLWHIWRER